MKNITFLIALFVCIFNADAQQNNFVIWTLETNGKIMSHPILDGSNIYIGSNDSTFYTVDIKTGSQVWNLKTNSGIRSQAMINNDIVYFKSGNDVYALNKVTGQEIWIARSEDKKGADKLDLWDYHSGSGAIYKSNIYFGFGNGQLKGFDLLTGEMKNKILRTDFSAIKSGLLIENSIIYFGDWDGRVYAYNLDTVAQLWMHKTYEEKLYSTFGQVNTELCIQNDLLFFGGRNPEMQVLDKNTGKKMWSYTELEGGWISGDPLVLNDTLFIGGSDNHEMFAFNANTGEKYWSYLFLNNNFSKALAYQDYLLFTTGDAYNVYGTSPGRGYIYALNRSDGSIKNFTKVGGNIYTNLIVKNDILYMGSADGSLYALDLKAFLNENSNLNTKGYNSIDITDISAFPFSDSVKISYKVNYSTKVKIKINDLNEDEIIKLYSGKINQGEHYIKWDGKNNNMDIVDDGYYFFEISSGEYFKKVIIHKQVSGK